MNLKQSSRQQSDDGRYFPRWEVANKITYKHERGVNFHECVSRDISNTGVCLRTYEKIQPQEKLLMTIELSDGASIQVQGRALWEKHDAKDFLVGLRFEDISEKIQEMIFNCAFECQKGQFQEKWYEGV
ncbi:MAG: PilZ domain-containing protein [Candidatus Aceula lacicola]|nr:PilZ domain-containing protein [Candidatus Aceula lacicola]